MSLLYRTGSIRAVDGAGQYHDVDVFSASSVDGSPDLAQLAYRVNREPARPISDGRFEVLSSGAVLSPVGRRPT